MEKFYLEPCPYCGHHNYACLTCAKAADPTTKYYHIVCDVCFLSGPIAETIKEAEDKWDALPRYKDTGEHR